MLRVCSWLVRDGNVDEAERHLAALVSDPELGRPARRLMAVCQQLRRSGLLDEVTPYGETLDGQSIDFSDESKILIARHAQSKRVLLVFTGNDNQMWITIGLIHKILRQHPWNIVYLRDPAKRVGYGFGLAQLGRGFRETVAGMKDLVRTLGGGKVYCVGNSSGGFAALRYGLDLNATGVLVFSPTTTNARDFGPAAKRGNTPEEINAAGSFFSDIRKIYARHESLPKVRVVFGSDHESDAAAAQHIADLPGVTLEPIDGFAGHDVIAETILHDRLRSLVTDLWSSRRQENSAGA